MPIEVRHGEPDMAALAALAAIMGAGQQQVPEIPRIQIGGVSAGGGGGGVRGTRHEQVPWHRRAWGGPVTRRAEPTPEEQLQYEAEKMQLQQKAETEGWEERYSAKARQDIAIKEKARQDLAANPAFDKREKMIGDRALILDILGVDKDVVPPDPNEMRFPDIPHPETGEPQPAGVGMEWLDQFGNVKTRKADGEVVTQVKYPDTKRGRDEAHRNAMELESAKRETKIEDLRRAYAIKLDEMKVPIMQEAEEGKWYGGAKEAGQIGERPLTEAEKKQRLDYHFGLQPGQEVAGVMEQPQPQAAEQGLTGPQELIRVTHAMQERGVLIPRESDADLPHFVGMAKSFMRKMKSESERGRDISPYAEAIQEAKIILRNYDASR